MFRLSEDLLAILWASARFPHLGQNCPEAGIWYEQDGQVLKVLKRQSPFVPLSKGGNAKRLL